MTLRDLLGPSKLNNTLLFGYYGGGNFGDELLLAILLRLFKDNGIADVSYYYLDRKLHDSIHRTDPYRPVYGKVALLGRLWRSDNLIIGGGGHWGLDANLSVFILSLLLFLARFLLRKRVYLVGVGFYSSTNTLGRASAFLAAKAANHIMARDDESFANFCKYSRHVTLDKDIAWYLDARHLNVDGDDVLAISDKLQLRNGIDYTLVTLRRFQDKYRNKYAEFVERLVAERRGEGLVLMLLEPKEVDPEGYEVLLRLKQEYPALTISDNSFNPLSFAAFCKAKADGVRLIAPQYHAQLIAALVGMEHMPIAYDNKVRELLRHLERQNVIDIQSLQYDDLERYAADAA